MKNHGKLTFRSLVSKSLPVCLLLGLSLAACKDSEFDEYYERPGWLDKPAVDILKGRSDCSTYIQLVEKTLFSKQLEGSGSYTFFVPNDAAFQAFFNDNPYGYRSVDDIPDDVAADIVSSLMLYNQYPCDSLGSVLIGYNTWNRGSAYKHQTPAYEVLSRDLYNGDSVWVFDDYAAWSKNWHNYRHLPVFTALYFQSSSLSTTQDYQHFYPQSSWSGYGNVLGAQILEASSGTGDLYCENGVIHIIDKVVLPLKNFDRMIQDYPKGPADMPDEAKGGAWDFMNKLVYHRGGDGSYQFLTFDEDVTARHYYEDVYPDRDLTKFYRRAYNEFPLLNIEAYPTWDSRAVEGDDSYNSGYTLFLPTTEVINDYIENRILQYVSHDGWNESQAQFDAAFNELSDQVPLYIYRSLFANGIIWPTDLASAQNLVTSGAGKEYVNGGMTGFAFDAAHFQSSAFASNGVYHIARFMPRTAAFEGVGSRFLLDPNYSGMEQVFSGNLNNSVYKNMLLSELGNYGQVQLNVVLNSDALLRQWGGINYDAVDGRFELSDGTDVNTGVNAMATLGYVERDTTDRVDFEVDPLDGAYGGWGFTTASQGNIIRYKKSGRTIQGKPEIIVQSVWTLQNDPVEGTLAQSSSTAISEFTPNPEAMPQTADPTVGTYASVIKDPTYDGYINGNVYIATEESAPLYFSNALDVNGVSFSAGARLSLYNSVEQYLKADSAQATPRHALFKNYWDHAKSAAQAPAIGSGFFTVLIPTDEALTRAVEAGLMVPYETMVKLDGILLENRSTTYNYADTAAFYVNAYIISTDALPDDGASTLYTSNLWNLSQSAPLEMGSAGFPVSTSCRPMADQWEDLMSGTTKMSMYLSKVDGTGRDKNKLKFLGRAYLQGSMTAVAAINASDRFPTEFDNTVVRELGQSNVLGMNGVIHSLNGFVIYQVLEK